MENELLETVLKQSLRQTWSLSDSIDLLRNSGFVAFQRIFGQFLILFRRGNINMRILPPKKNQKLAEKILKVD